MPPVVVQERNPHNPLADMAAETDLYFKSLTLVEHLIEWKGSAKSLPGRYEELVIDLYERGFLGKNDVFLVQAWLGALVTIGYKFPPISN